MNALLISTYELGHQPFGLASPAAWLKRAGIGVACLDLSREPMREDAVRQADFIAFYLPMHTATRLAVRTLPAVRRLNPGAHLCFYGLYAPLNADYLRALGAQTILGGEFEEELVKAAQRVRNEHGSCGSDAPHVDVPMGRLNFLTPDRERLPSLARYAHLERPESGSRVAGYTEASRGCKHLCRHCPIVPVYNGRFRIVQREVVLDDVRQQIESGAQHITFGDPDFFNGIRHALRVVTEFKQRFPGVTYDVTIKVEHLLKHSEHLRTLRETGCLFVTSAVESVDDAVLARLNKGHTLADFRRVASLFRDAGLVLSPTFVAFTPWITPEGYAELLNTISELDLITHVAPVQLGIRLLITAGSRLLELDEVRALIGPFNETRLIYPWTHADCRVEALYEQVQDLILNGIARKESRSVIFSHLREAAARASGAAIGAGVAAKRAEERPLIPFLSEPWYCCAEPAGNDLDAVRVEEQQV